MRKPHCERIANSVEDDAAAGFDYEGGGITITALGQPLIQGSTAELALRADIASLSVLRADGTVAEEESSPGYADLSGGAAVEWRGATSSWVMRTLTLE